MSTRGIIAVTQGADIVGVYHRFESMPCRLGEALLDGLVALRGDLPAAMDPWIHNAPGGWSSLVDGQRSTQGDDLDFWGRRDLADQGWVEWVYLFDERSRTVSVWRGNPEDDARWDEPDEVLTIAANGSATPPRFSES